MEVAQVKSWLFGGWAEELRGLRPPGPHRDIDVLYPASDFTRLEEFLRSCSGVEEIVAKRFVHKRAFLWKGVMAEAFLVRPQPDGHVTDFFASYRFIWPGNTFEDESLSGLNVQVASSTALMLYRRNHSEVEHARERYFER